MKLSTFNKDLLKQFSIMSSLCIVHGTFVYFTLRFLGYLFPGLLFEIAIIYFASMIIGTFIWMAIESRQCTKYYKKSIKELEESIIRDTNLLKELEYKKELIVSQENPSQN